ncbi:peptidylprolyl isomerase [Angomonas deanei]|nr:peptidylprolyl isomerase [Angomonas deanei]|eukprot:EPY41917.1 peptidylprolyl isomerase [Angomonas deanei]
MHTNKGLLRVELYANDFADSFIRLALSGQLNGHLFKYLVPGCLIAGEVENPFGVVSHQSVTEKTMHTGIGLFSAPRVTGTVAASSFVVTLSPQPQFDDACVVFGRLCDGLDVLQSIQELQVRENFEFISPLVVERCSLIKNEA